MAAAGHKGTDGCASRSLSVRAGEHAVSIMVRKKCSGQKKRDKPSKKQKVEHDVNCGRWKGRGKRKGEEDKGSERPSKEPKVDHQGEGEEVPKVKREASVGRACNINSRHSNQLESLLALMSVKWRSLEIIDDRDKILKYPGCSCGLYMEWSKEDDQYFLWGSTGEGKIQIKFEFHGGFEPSANLLDVKKPMLAFSESFDLNSCWSEVKKMLRGLFGHVDGEVPSGSYDYMLAFMRTGEMLHLHIFKFHTQPTTDMKSMRLEGVSPTFILKPLEIYCQGDDLTEDLSIEHFIDEDMLMTNMRSGLNLVESNVFYDDSYQYMVPHVMCSTVSHRVMLPFPGKSLQSLGFNTSHQEFFERYHAYRRTHVPGTGHDPNLTTTSPVAAADIIYYDYITVAMKVFARGLIMCVKENHRYGCLSDFDENNIFLKRGRVLIVGVKLLPYSTEQALQNFRAAHAIILSALEDMSIPTDLQCALDLLVSDPIGSYCILENNFAWMIASRRQHMVDELHEDFTELGPDTQVNMTRTLPDMDKWLSKFANNSLLFDVLTDKLPAKAKTSLEVLQQYFEKKAAETQRKAIKNNELHDKLVESNHEDDGLQLFTGRKYFKGLRNSYVHVSETSFKKNKVPLSKEMVDIVVSSEFAATCSSIQVTVPTILKKTDAKRGSFERFKIYFSGVEDIEFEKSDEK
ncbi:hypothetical protein Zm00014a_009120 [Zea mays]|uniref:Uncharacterized protein n=1 Tax=Zea mays TaxID=4577 RepID=A0A3L6DAI0_MAIZE|nr:hypothetical protein Zm00014a_009118 [Zea mays]PWZ06874.1 hypothetical protein Zm00014a_009120 [Zea mays]